MSSAPLIPSINNHDRSFLDLIRGISIMRVVLVHLGLSWFFPPYSEYIHTLLPILFFVSGAVSYYSYLRSRSVSIYLIKRVVSIYIPYLFLLFILFPFRWLYLRSIPELNLITVLNYLTLNLGEMKDAVFPLGQVWFLHSLVIIIILSSIFFVLYSKYKKIFFVIILSSIFLSILQAYINIHPYFYFLGHNFYHPLVYSGFFIFGAWFYSNKKYFDKRLLFFLMLTSLSIFICFLAIVNDVSMNVHATKPDIYYTSLSYFFVFFVLFFDNTIVKINDLLPPLKKLFTFMGTHSYSVFLLHSLVLWYVHNELGLANVMSSPPKALLKIILVILITCVL